MISIHRPCKLCGARKPIIFIRVYELIKYFPRWSSLAVELGTTRTRHIPPLGRTRHRDVRILENVGGIGKADQVVLAVAVEFDFSYSDQSP